jgi:transcriptional regulator with XRE-family HTH domain
MGNRKRWPLDSEAKRALSVQMKDTGERLRAARKRRRFTQAQPSVKVGLSQSCISDAELGDGGSLSIAAWQRMALVLGIPLKVELGRDPLQLPEPAQPVGFRPELPNALYESQNTGWAQPLIKRRPEITADMTDQFLTRMFKSNPDFVFTVSREFVKSCQTPVLVLPDDTAGHSLMAAIESAMLAPKGQMSMYPWKDTPEKIPLAVRHVRSFLMSHRPA